MKLSLQQISWNHLCLIVRYKGRGQVAIQSVLDDLIVLCSAEQDADTRVLMGAFPIAVERLKVKGVVFRIICRSLSTLFVVG